MERSMKSLNDKMETHNIEMLALRAENNTLKTKLGNNEKLNRQLQERLKQVE